MVVATVFDAQVLPNPACTWPCSSQRACHCETRGHTRQLLLQYYGVCATFACVESYSAYNVVVHQDMSLHSTARLMLTGGCSQLVPFGCQNAMP
jgi:hypothetical protein